MLLVHEVKCVVCEKVEYVPVKAGAQSARQMKGICDDCGEERLLELKNGKKKEDEPAEKPESVSARRTSKAS